MFVSILSVFLIFNFDDLWSFFVLVDWFGGGGLFWDVDCFKYFVPYCY